VAGFDPPRQSRRDPDLPPLVVPLAVVSPDLGEASGGLASLSTDWLAVRRRPRRSVTLLGLPVFGGHAQHVVLTVPPGEMLPARLGIAAHRAALPGDDVVELDGLRVTAPARTILDLAAELELDQVVAVADAALRCGAVTSAEFITRQRAATGRRGVRTARLATTLMDPRAASAPESIIRVRIVRSGLPAPVPQLVVLDGSGQLVATVDLGYDDARIGIEYEGRQHAAAEQFDRDIARYRRTVGARLAHPAGGPRGSASGQRAPACPAGRDAPRAAEIRIHHRKIGPTRW